LSKITVVRVRPKFSQLTRCSFEILELFEFWFLRQHSCKARNVRKALNPWVALNILWDRVISEVIPKGLSDE